MKRCIILISSMIISLLFLIHTSYAHANYMVLKHGMSGSAVMDMQTKLKNCGYYSGNIDGKFGQKTLDAVLEFQTRQGLETDGIAGARTLKALDEVAGNLVISRGGKTYNLLKMGMSGEGVRQLQEKLKQFGFYQGSPDGIFGPMTRLAVVNFQLSCGLYADGIAGSQTLHALNNYVPVTSVSRGGDERKKRAIVSYALKFIGTPYVWGGNSPDGFDCSGFTSYIYKEHGIYLPHAADEQFSSGQKVKQPNPGDLVFFTTYEAGPSHVGIYVGNNQFVHSSSGAGEVCVTSLSESYYSSRYLGSVRVID